MRETDPGPGRPDADECLPCYFTYIDLVPDGHLMKLLDRQISESASFLTVFTPGQALWREAPGEWNVEIVGRSPMPSASPRAPHRARRPRHVDRGRVPRLRAGRQLPGSQAGRCRRRIRR